MRSAIIRTASGHGPLRGVWGYVVAGAAVAALFFLSDWLQDEPHALFSLIYVVTAVLISIFIGRGPGILAGFLVALSVDFLYIPPVDRLAATPFKLLFAILVLGVVQGALAGVALVQHAVRDAEVAIHAREEVLTIVAHDLRQPLTALAMREDLVRRKIQEGRLAEALKASDQSKTALARMDVLIQDLLDSAKIDEGRLSLSLAEAALDGVASSVLESFKLQAGRRGLTLKLRGPAGGVPKIPLDEARIARVFSNLVANALKFTPSGGSVTVEIREEAHTLLASVRDSGPGISRSDQEFLFRRRWQARSTSAQGNGLGL
ncbi:MAG TPA: HAMP domain-containing sensor histidine kinase, partial [Bdellovibrionota bacterium]|nr:HAMP domain-containing sensor histidine kinase [Bdellovibrionota bacterium]